jgi:hypothetical protein
MSTELHENHNDKSLWVCKKIKQSTTVEIPSVQITMIFQQLAVVCLIFSAPIDSFRIMSTSTTTPPTTTQLAATGKIADSVLDLIGNTPLVKLNKVSAGCEAEIVAKLESSNPANSVKDRIALSMINEAEKRGEITPGKTILVGTLELHRE